MTDIPREGLTITAIGRDENWEEYRIQASNGSFSGSVYVYAELGSARVWANQLAGFPRDVTDRRQLACGWVLGPNRAGGLVELRFACIDRGGHAVLDIAVSGEQPQGGSLDERAQFQVNISAAGVDQFVQQLQSLSIESEFSAYLPAER